MDAHSYEVTTTRKVVSIPTKFSGTLEHGEPIKNLHDALYLITQEAEALGVNTSFDDWATYTSDEDHIYVHFEVSP